MKPSARFYRAFLDLLMVSDPFPLPESDHSVLQTQADYWAEQFGYSNWIEAYHEFKP